MRILLLLLWMVPVCSGEVTGVGRRKEEEKHVMKACDHHPSCRRSPQLSHSKVSCTRLQMQQLFPIYCRLLVVLALT